MTNEQFLKGMAILEATYDNFTISSNEALMLIWFESLQEENENVFFNAIRLYMNSEKFKPTLASIREKIRDIKNPYTDFTCEDAWKEVQDAIRYCGSYEEEKALARMSPITQSIVRSLGYKYLCLSEDMMADRAHFIKMFDAHSKREKDNLMLPSSVKNETLKLRDGMLKMLGDGMDMNKIV